MQMLIIYKVDVSRLFLWLPLAPWKACLMSLTAQQEPFLQKALLSNVKVGSDKWVNLVLLQLGETVTRPILKNYKSFLQRNRSLIFFFFCQLLGHLSFSPPVVKHSLVNNVLPANSMVGNVSLRFFMILITNMLYNPFADVITLVIWSSRCSSLALCVFKS